MVRKLARANISGGAPAQTIVHVMPDGFSIQSEGKTPGPWMANRIFAEMQRLVGRNGARHQI